METQSHHKHKLESRLDEHDVRAQARTAAAVVMELCNSEMKVTHCDLSRTLCRRRAMKKSRASTKSSAVVAAIASLLFCSFLLQPAAAAARESSKGYDGDLTLFSPEGRLYQVEYVMKAVGHYGCPAVGVHGDGCCVVACKRDLPDELVYPDSVSSIFRISDEIYSAATGMRGDVLYQVKRAQLQAVEYKRQYGSPMPSRLLTLAMADAAQVKTQHAALRPMACVCFIISVDDPAGPTLFRVEPSGQAFQAWGTAAGRGSAASLEFLEETLDRAREREQNKAGTSTPDEENKKTPDKLASNHSEVAGGASSTGGGGEGSAAEENGAGTGGSLSQDSASSALSEDSASSALSEDSASSEGRGGAEGEVGAGAGKSELSGGGGVPRVGWTAGFGVVGVEGTVELALQALSKASSGKDSPPLTDKNVEIAIASRDSGIRVCSRKEVRGFLGKMKLSSTDCVSAGGR